eukprot:gnl/TRDRNA2_/TRDRNA2_182525_c0_seq1.p1 gnl/TRDRNA2_/TRDRNA2_182525_c0~~gnl/TRDRNA2_/TRDRNA2_182525_c0_seq1.p1  ORF type:complete len:184 (+),score=19.53 gnl/TRDRNA2_/TRDRNA2_182525_c0_seq1:76-552(+)
MPGAFAQRTNEDAGVNYLRGSKVGSSTGYLCVAGTILAIPHSTSRSKSTPATTRTRFDANSEHAVQFREMPHCYASMDRKPLVPYDPNSYRSRLAIDDAPVPFKNASSIEFGNSIHTCHKRRFLTTSQVSYTGEPCDPRSNQGMVAESSKFNRAQRDR